jgi:16S rRNA (guanine(966)-N(2))-methyltransferase RsmD
MKGYINCMRIISGKARGTKLNTLEGLDTRPTLDRIKESLFNIIQDKIYDSEVLDLFAGSGALGLETLSRGAKKAFFCDNSRKAVKIIEDNITKTHFENNAIVINKDFYSALESIKDFKFDIIFLDPPYKTDYDIKALKYIIENKMLNDDGIIILETDRETEKRNYGRVSLFFLK